MVDTQLITQISSTESDEKTAAENQSSKAELPVNMCLRKELAEATVFLVTVLIWCESAWQIRRNNTPQT